MGSWRLLFCTFTALAVAEALPSSAAAADDVHVRLCVAVGEACFVQPRAAQLTFGLGIDAQSTSGVTQAVRATVDLPSGLRWTGAALSPGCSGTDPIVCTGEVERHEVGTSERWTLELVAERPGRYEISASLTTTEPDPDLSNNTFRFAVDVEQPASTTPPAARLAAGLARVAPARPRAGRTVSASVAVRVGGDGVRPSAVRCSATAGSVKLKSVARARRGTAWCLVRTPKTAAGTTLRGSISFRAAGRLVTRRFTVKLR